MIESFPIAIANRGRTRADGLATLKVDTDCLETLTGALAQITSKAVH